MQRVLYWEKVIGNTDVAQEYPEVIQQLLEDPNHNGLHLEKLGNSKVFSARATKKVRIIFKEYNGCLLILDVL